MPYCPSCGREVKEGENYCPYCGGALPQQQASSSERRGYNTSHQGYTGPDQGGYQQPLVYGTEKSTGVAIILGLIVGLIGLWGIGQMYVGRIARGVMFLILGLILMPALVLIGAFGMFVTAGLSLLLIFALPIVYLVLWIYQGYDAYKLAQEYNMHLSRTGSPPW